jgi:ribonucleoside-diphosphate reductase alpha chain
VFCVAYKRRFIDNDRKWKYQYVIDPTANRLNTEFGIDPDKIEDAYTLAYNPEKRIKFQADLQRYVDHGISSTLNLPEPVEDPDDVRYFGDTLRGYLPHLRGITTYPDGARSGQPLTVATYAEAIENVGVTLEENRDQQCMSGVCGV